MTPVSASGNGRNLSIPRSKLTTMLPIGHALARDTATPLAAIGAEPLAPLGDLFIGNLAEQDVGNLEVDPRADRA